MSYIDFRPVVKKVNLKPNGVKEVVLEVKDDGLNGKLDSLSEMIDSKVSVSLESEVVNFNVTLNARTDKPLKNYQVDDKGIVSEVKEEGDQLEADLGIPEEDVPTKEKQEHADREKVDAFIIEGMAPNYDDLPYDFANIVKRKEEGETYLKLANELNISSGKIVELVDEYRKRVAPLAIKWWEWKEGQDSEKEDKLVNENKEDGEEQDTEDDNEQHGAA